MGSVDERAPRYAEAVESVLEVFDTVMNVRAECCEVARVVMAVADAEIAAQVEAAVSVARAEAWDKGYTAGHSNAMRRMSDEPNVPKSQNPYFALQAPSPAEGTGEAATVAGIRARNAGRNTAVRPAPVVTPSAADGAS